MLRKLITFSNYFHLSTCWNICQHFGIYVHILGKSQKIGIFVHHFRLYVHPWNMCSHFEKNVQLLEYVPRFGHLNTFCNICPYFWECVQLLEYMSTFWEHDYVFYFFHCFVCGSGLNTWIATNIQNTGYFRPELSRSLQYKEKMLSQRKNKNFSIQVLFFCFLLIDSIYHIIIFYVPLSNLLALSLYLSLSLSLSLCVTILSFFLLFSLSS